MTATTRWTPDHFIGGHPALDLANAVYDRRMPVADNDLFGSIGDVASWLVAIGLASDVQAEAVSNISDPGLVARVRDVREATFAIFDAIAAGKAPPTDALGALLHRTGRALSRKPMELQGTRSALALLQWRDGDAVEAHLALLSVEAFFVLPRDRIRSCPRCGWIFVDRSRGGRRRWCSMQTCGNREKTARYRDQATA